MCAWLSGVSFVGQAEYADMVSIFDFNMRPVRTPSLAPHYMYALRQMDPHGVLTGALEQQGPSTFPRPDCAGGCGSSMGTNPGRTHRFCAPPARRRYQLQKDLVYSTSACLTADTGKAVVPFVTLTVPVFAARSRTAV